MENATDALKMAASLLIFVVALSISINAFSRARQTSQIILDYSDREYDYTYVEENKDQNGNILTERLVGIETIIPNIYKAYSENYKIVFENLDSVYEKKNSKTGERDKIKYIDLEKEAIGSEEDKLKFIEAIIYGAGTETKTEFEKRNIYLSENGIYQKISNTKLKESLGVYYQEELYSNNNNEPEANKTKKRVITYSIP